ncbi:hypothetical protein [Psychrobacillus sp. BM2]
MKNNLLALSVCLLAISILVIGGLIAKELGEKDATPQTVMEVAKDRVN